MNWSTYFINLAVLASKKSKDPSTKVGSVIVKNNIILSTGFNGFPIGFPDKDEWLNNSDKYFYVAHSEQNCISLAARNGIQLEESTLYTLFHPCNECSKSIIQAGIKKVCHLDIELNDKWAESIKYAKQMFYYCGIVTYLYREKVGDKILVSGKEIEI